MAETYRFVGDFALVVTADDQCIQLDQFGQAVELTDEQARIDHGNRVALLPEDKFNSFGFTDEELRKYPNSSLQADAPASFHQKKQEALDAFRELLAPLYQTVEEQKN